MAQIIGGQPRQQLEQRRQTLIDTRLARMGELAAARDQVTDLEIQVARLEGAIVEAAWMLEQIASEEET